MKRVCSAIWMASLLGGMAPGNAAAQNDTEASAPDDTAAGDVEPAAEQVLRRACAYLKSIDRFSVRTETSHDEVLEIGYKLQYSRASQILVARPNRFRVESESDKGYRTTWYDGASLTILDEDVNVYARFDVPDTIDATLDVIADRGITLPLDDLLSSNPCAGLGEHVREGYYVGLNYMDGDYRHQLLLVTDTVDVQLWIEDDDTPLIRKVVITYREEPGEPQFLALLRDWDVAPTLTPSDFVFAPPSGAHEINLVAAPPTE